MNTAPVTRLEYSIVEMIAGATARTGWTQEELSENLGYDSQYLKNAKVRKRLAAIPAGALLKLAAMAGREMRFIEKE